MPDISMCSNKSCPMKDTCYRFTAAPSEFSQAYQDYQPDEGDCRGYWPMKRNNAEAQP